MTTRSIYFAKCGDKIKVGIANDVPARLRQLRVGAAQKVALLASVAGDAQLERDLHKRLKRFHVDGEWFRDCPEVRQVILQCQNSFDIAPDRAKRVRKNENFGRACKGIWPFKTAEELASRVGCSVRCAFGQLSGEREPSARSILVVLTEIIPKQRK